MLTWRCRLQLGGRPDQFLHCQAFAETARSAKIEVIRYTSVRDPGQGMNLALLTCRAFACASGPALLRPPQGADRRPRDECRRPSEAPGRHHVGHQHAARVGGEPGDIPLDQISHGRGSAAVIAHGQWIGPCSIYRGSGKKSHQLAVVDDAGEQTGERQPHRYRGSDQATSAFPVRTEWTTS
jgi:hypothetical protein